MYAVRAYCLIDNLQNRQRYPLVSAGGSVSPTIRSRGPRQRRYDNGSGQFVAAGHNDAVTKRRDRRIRQNGRRSNAGRQRFGAGHVLIFVVCTAFGGGLLFTGLRMQHDHDVLGTRGASARAVITAVHSGSGGPSVDVRFTTADGREVHARVKDADSPGGLYEGSPIEIRYDPLDPSGRVESARGDPATATRWFLVVSGALLLGLVGYGSWWWGREGVRRRRRRATV